MNNRIYQIKESGPVDPKMKDIQKKVNRINNKKFLWLMFSWLLLLSIILIIWLIAK